MDKLLLSPDYSASNNETNMVWESLAVEAKSSILTPPCLNPSPLLNLLASPTTELLEFLTFNSKNNGHLAENALLLDPAWGLIQASLQYETPQIFPSTVSTELDILDSEIYPQLQNVIASANLCCKLDLRRIAMYAQNAEYNPRRLPALYMRIRKPYALALIFSNGKLICTGSPNVQMSHQAARKFARIIQKLGFPVKFMNYKVENLIASCEVKFSIRLELFELFMHSNCVYEPELFPGLIFRLTNSRAQILIFSSGRIILSGAKQKYELQKAFREIYPLLKIFKKKS